MKEGKYCGLEMVWFTNNNTDKTQKLSLVNYNLSEYGADGTDTNIVSNCNYHFCTVRRLKYHIENNLPRYWTGLLYLKKAIANVL
jgi:hypothetical protein